MKEYSFVYAVRNKNTGEMINKRKGNPFFTSRYQAERLKEFENDNWWNKEKGQEFEVVSFKLVEVK